MVETCRGMGIWNVAGGGSADVMPFVFILVCIALAPVIIRLVMESGSDADVD